MSQLPEGLAAFVENAGWGGAAVAPLPGDASFRRYFRLTRAGGESAMLMHAPPPHEDPAPFLHVAHWLNDNAMRAPAILAAEPQAGWVLTEDFGNDRMRDWLDEHPADEREAYAAAVDAPAALYRLLEEEVVPAFYDRRDADDAPPRWLAKVRHTLSATAPEVSADRMVREYATAYYRPAARSAARRVSGESHTTTTGGAPTTSSSSAESPASTGVPPR